jgi:hypothetical protein
MDEEAVREVAEAMVQRVVGDLGSAEQLSDIGLAIAKEHGLTEEETAAAFDQALVRLKMLRLRMMHISDQKQAAEESEQPPE